MNHIAEITLTTCTALLSFDPDDEKAVQELEEVLGEWVDEGLVYCLEFHIQQ